jgi:catechol 2,3-dioxygenase-like lactoylglutathione lyase family enzyme
LLCALFKHTHTGRYDTTKNAFSTKKTCRADTKITACVHIEIEERMAAESTFTNVPGIPAGLYKIRLVVGDVRRSLGFYNGFLGLRIAWTEERTSGGLSVACVELNETEVILAGPGGGRTLPPAGKRGLGLALYLEVRAIDEWFALACEHGYTPLDPMTMEAVSEPVERPGGEISFALRDPDGYDIRLSELL